MGATRRGGSWSILKFAFPEIYLLHQMAQSARALDEKQQRQQVQGAGPPPRPLASTPPPRKMVVDEETRKAHEQRKPQPNTRPLKDLEPPSRAQPKAPPRPYTMADLEGDLSQIVGLDHVKETIRDIFAQVSIERQLKSGSTGSVSLHMVFLGNPGTGKTIVARLVGQMFKRMGVLSSGHFIETDAAGLIAGYVGQTRIQTEAKVREAMGGVLFIDEAYAMIDAENPRANSFGKEAIQVLIKQMEDHRDNLCVIFAGYTKEMEPFIQTNPGMESRIAFRLKFDDYSPSDLMNIIRQQCAKRARQFDAEALDYLSSFFDGNRSRIGEWGNGRWTRKVLEAAILKHSRRLIQTPNHSAQALQTLTGPDVRAWEEGRK